MLHACWCFTYPWNLTGLPALSVPCGFADGLPVGPQLVGRPDDPAAHESAEIPPEIAPRPEECVADRAGYSLRV